MLEIRCSALPRLTQCAAAILPPKVRIGAGKPAALGSAFHKCMAERINSTVNQIPDIDPIDPVDAAIAFDVDSEELSPMVWWAWKLWQDMLKPLFPNPEVEQGMKYFTEDGKITLTGHSDVQSLVPYEDGFEARVIDWKTGFVDEDATDQLKGYGFLALQRFPSAARARATKLRVRDRRAETAVWTRGELEKWWVGVTRHLEDYEAYRPGPQCRYCPRALECEARARELRFWLEQFFISGSEAGEQLMRNASGLSSAVQMARQIKDGLDSFLDRAKEEVIAEGGQFGNLFIQQQDRRKVEVDRAWDLLVETLGMDKLVSLLKVSKTELEAAVKAGAARGNKGKVAKAFTDALEQRGALSLDVVQILRVRSAGDGMPALDEVGDGNAS